jgi:hypothetical protein
MLDGQPLIEPHAIDDDQIDGVSGIQMRQHTLSQDVGRHERTRFSVLDPLRVALFDELPEIAVQLALHVGMGLPQPVVLDLTQGQLEIRHAMVKIRPFVLVQGAHAHGLEAIEFGHIVPGERAMLDLGFFSEPFEGGKDLGGIDGFHQVVIDAPADRFLHEQFFFALGDEHDREGGVQVLDRPQGGDAAHARHHLVQKHRVEGLGFHPRQCILAVQDGDDFVALPLQEAYVRFEEIDFVVGPQDPVLRRAAGHVRDCTIRPLIGSSDPRGLNARRGEA